MWQYLSVHFSSRPRVCAVSGSGLLSQGQIWVSFHGVGLNSRETVVPPAILGLVLEDCHHRLSPGAYANQAEFWTSLSPKQVDTRAQHSPPGTVPVGRDQKTGEPREPISTLSLALYFIPEHFLMKLCLIGSSEIRRFTLSGSMYNSVKLTVLA